MPEIKGIKKNGFVTGETLVPADPPEDRPRASGMAQERPVEEDSRAKPATETAGRGEKIYDTLRPRSAAMMLDKEVFPESDPLIPSPQPEKKHWSVVWSDLMMTMFILFAVLYVYQNTQSGAGGVVPQTGQATTAGRDNTTDGEDRGESEANPEDSGDQKKTPRQGNADDISPARIFNLSQEAVRQEIVDQEVKVDLAPDKTVRIVLTGDLLFDTGKVDIRPTAIKTLERVGQVLRQMPYVVNVVGHTDNVPIRSERYPTNWELSTARATSVTRYLIDQLNLPADRFYVSGHAFYRPLKGNDSAEDRAANRRVEIIITRDMPAGLANHPAP